MKPITRIIRASVFGFCTLLTLMTFSTQVVAISDLQQGLKAQNDGDLAGAASYFQTAAQAGSSEGQYQLGLLYAQGIGIKVDLANAKILMQKAADQGHILASEWLGMQAVPTLSSWEEEEEDPEDDC